MTPSMTESLAQRLAVSQVMEGVKIDWGNEITGVLAT